MIFDKCAMKNNVQHKMQIAFFLMASKNVEFDHMCRVIVYRYFLICAHDCEVWINYFCPVKQFRSRSMIFLKIYLNCKCKVSFNKYYL